MLCVVIVAVGTDIRDLLAEQCSGLASLRMLCLQQLRIAIRVPFAEQCSGLTALRMPDLQLIHIIG